ncbi:hypothetical protein EYF80_009402 [Liparis tanakae]|uniref:Uncharacterized protein n=1 Tax=Liparis tanakae TaxID=230148 RepID=A0A4Z2IRZ9_9TELE|nr:hypothetical protein EYF80_009402 [Liparis tanakae]
MHGDAINCSLRNTSQRHAHFMHSAGPSQDRTDMCLMNTAAVSGSGELELNGSLRAESRVGPRRVDRLKRADTSHQTRSQQPLSRPELDLFHAPPAKDARQSFDLDRRQPAFPERYFSHPFARRPVSRSWASAPIANDAPRDGAERSHRRWITGLPR